MAFDLRYYFTIKSLHGETFNFFIKNEDSATTINGVNAIFNDIGGGQFIIESDTPLTGATIGGTLVISGSNNNDGRHFITNIQSQAPPYSSVYWVSGTLFVEEDTSGFTVKVEASQKVKTFHPVTKWGEETSFDGSDLTGKFQPIQRSYTDIPLLDQSGGSYQDIFDQPVGAYLLEVYEGFNNFTEVFWVGRSIPGVFSRQLFGQDYFTTVRFSCGLSIAGQKRFYVDDPDNDTQKLMDVLLYSLTEGAGISLPVNECINVYQVGMTTTEASSPLKQLNVNQELYYEEEGTFLDFIKNMCQLFGARIFQWNGTWTLQKINELSGEYLQRSYDNTGAFLSSQWIPGTRIITKVYGERESNYLQVIPAAGWIKAKFNENLKGGPYFTGGPLEENVSALENGFFEGWSGGIHTPDDWTVATASAWEVTRASDAATGRFACQLDRNGVLADEYIQNSFTGSFTGFGTAVRYIMRVRFKVVQDNPSYSPKNTSFKWSLSRHATTAIPGNIYVWWDHENSDWFTTSVGPDDNEINNVCDTVYTANGEYFIYEATIDNEPSNYPGISNVSDIVVRIKNDTNTDIFIDSVVITEKPPEAIYDARTESAPSVTNTSRPLQNQGGDLEFNIIRPLDGLGWNRRGQTDNVFLAQLLMTSMEAELNQQQKAITGAIRTPSMNFDLPIEIGGERYIPNGVTYDYTQGEWRGQWVQLISSPVYTRLPQI